MLCIKKEYGSTIKFVICISLGIWAVMAIMVVVGCSEDKSEKANFLIEEGDKYYVSQKYIDAINKWQEALLLTPDSQEIMRRIGLANLSIGELNTAGHYLKMVLEKNPEDIEVRSEIIRIKILKYELKKAGRLIKEVSEELKDNIDIIMLQGDLEMVKNQYNEAEKYYSMALSIDKERIAAKIRLAMSKYANGNIKLSEDLIKNVDVEAITDPVLLLQLGDYHRLLKNRKDAEEAYENAVRYSDGNYGFQLHLINYYLDIEENEKAIDYLKAIIANDPDHVEARKLMVQAYLTTGNLGKADIHLRALEILEKNNSELYLLRGQYYLQSAEPVIAETYFENILRNDPDSAIAHYWSGIALLISGQVQIGKQHLIQAIAIAPHFTEAELALAGLYYKSKEYDLALEHLRRTLKKEPDNVRAAKLLGGILLEQKQYKDALSAFKKAEVINPKDNVLKYYIGLCYESLGDIDGAKNIYLKVLEKEYIVYAGLRYAKLLATTNQYDVAEKYFSALLSKQPENIHILYILGEINLDKGNIDQAIYYFEKSLLLDKAYLASYIRLSDLYKSWNNNQMAKKTLEQSVENRNNSLIVFLKTASICYEENLIDETLEVLRNAENLFPENDILKNNLAYLYLQKNVNLNKALELAQSAYKNHPDNATFLDTLGWVYHKKGMHRQALWYLKRGLQVLENENCNEADSCAIIRYHLGSVYFSLQEYDDAEKQLRASTETGLNGSDADKAYNMLEYIQNKKQNSKNSEHQQMSIGYSG